MKSRNLIIKDNELLGFNKIRIKRFMKNLAAIYRRSEKRKRIHQDLHKQLDRVHHVSLSKAEKSEVEKEIHLLKEKINSLLEMKGQPALPSKQTSSQLQKKIIELEAKLAEVLNRKTDREERIEQIERKIKDKFRDQGETKEMVQTLREQISILTRKFSELSEKKHDKKKLELVKKRLDQTKHALRDIESKNIEDQFS